jgi:hypothetical protein
MSHSVVVPVFHVTIWFLPPPPSLPTLPMGILVAAVSTVICLVMVLLGGWHAAIHVYTYFYLQTNKTISVVVSPRAT